MTTHNFTARLRAASSLDDLPINPIAAMLRRHTSDEFTALKASIKLVGVTNPIGLDADGALVDGRHRCQAVIELRAEGIEVADPPINTISCDPADYVWAQICGRQMSKGQLAYLAIQICRNSDTTLVAAAERYGVHRDTLHQMKNLMEAKLELADQVAAGELSLNKAMNLLELGRLEVDRLEREADEAETNRIYEEELAELAQRNEIAQRFASTNPAAVAKAIQMIISREERLDIAIAGVRPEIYDDAWWESNSKHYRQWRAAVPEIAAELAAHNAQPNWDTVDLHEYRGITYGLQRDGEVLLPQSFGLHAGVMGGRKINDEEFYAAPGGSWRVAPKDPAERLLWSRKVIDDCFEAREAFERHNCDSEAPV